jgi:hypothetical protein
MAALGIFLTISNMGAQQPVENDRQSSTVKQTASANSSVEIVDLTPRFLKFYETAVAEKAEPERRWELWRQLYGFAAVPPTPEGMTMARNLLDHAWPDYPKHLDRIRQGAAVLKPSPQSILDKVVNLLGCNSAIRVKLIVYVGGLENNAFAYDDNGIPAIAIPVESNDKDLELTMTHEFTHAVHSKTAELSGGYDQVSVAQLVLMEGLAERVTEKLVPGQTSEVYVNAHDDQWLRESEANRIEILKGIRQHLDERGPAALSRFTFGQGTTGRAREAYFAGWVLVGELERQGMTPMQIAKLPQGAMSGILNKTIDSLIRNAP